MNRINISLWKPFAIEKLFTVVKGTRLTKANMHDGNIRFIGASAVNNGVTAYISNNEKIHSANTITVSYNGSVGEAFYQDQEFWASDDVNVLYPKFEMNQYIALFIIPLLKAAGRKYAFVDKWKKETMEKDLIFLPVDERGNPNFLYMETYMKNMEHTIASSLINLRAANTAESCNVVNTSAWKKFKLTQVLDLQKQVEISPIQAYYENNDSTEKYPFYGQSKINNGIISYISLEKKYLNNLQGHYAILIHSNTHECVYADSPFYLKDGHGATSIFSSDKLDKYSTLYIMSVLTKTMAGSFDYDKKATKDALKNLNIMLPIDSNGDPDYEYMSDYMKTLEKKSSQAIEQLSFA